LWSPLEKRSPGTLLKGKKGFPVFWDGGKIGAPRSLEKIKKFFRADEWILSPQSY
jgi:hypothetical protein